MIIGASLAKEIVATVENRVGVLADMSMILADQGINIEGVAGYETGSEAKIMLVVVDTTRAKDALVKAGYKNLKDNEVVVIDLENKPGALKCITAKLASAKIDIKYVYGTTCSEGCPAKIILATGANEKVLVALKAK